MFVVVGSSRRWEVVIGGVFEARDVRNSGRLEVVGCLKQWEVEAVRGWKWWTVESVGMFNGKEV